MLGYRRWLSSAALLAGTTAWAQSPAPPALAPPPAEPPIAVALPGGTVVGTHASSAGNVPVLTAANAAPPPPAGAPIVGPLPIAGGGPPAPAMLVPDGPLVTPITKNAATGGCTAPGGDCCGPTGANGPIGPIGRAHV